MTLLRYPLCALGCLSGLIVFSSVLVSLGFFRVELTWAAVIALLCAVPLALAIGWEDLEKLMGNRPEPGYTKSVL